MPAVRFHVQRALNMIKLYKGVDVIVGTETDKNQDEIYFFFLFFFLILSIERLLA